MPAFSFTAPSSDWVHTQWPKWNASGLSHILSPILFHACLLPLLGWFHLCSEVPMKCYLCVKPHLSLSDLGLPPWPSAPCSCLLIAPDVDNCVHICSLAQLWHWWSWDRISICDPQHVVQLLLPNWYSVSNCWINEWVKEGSLKFHS
jgi:hypothetical protein